MRFQQIINLKEIVCDHRFRFGIVCDEIHERALPLKMTEAPLNDLGDIVRVMLDL